MFMRLEMMLHRRSKKRRCTRRRKSCALRIPLIGICLWSTTKTVKAKCKRKSKKRSRR